MLLAATQLLRTRRTAARPHRPGQVEAEGCAVQHLHQAGCCVRVCICVDTAGPVARRAPAAAAAAHAHAPGDRGRDARAVAARREPGWHRQSARLGRRCAQTYDDGGARARHAAEPQGVAATAPVPAAAAAAAAAATYLATAGRQPLAAFLYAAAPGTEHAARTVRPGSGRGRSTPLRPSHPTDRHHVPLAAAGGPLGRAQPASAADGAAVRGAGHAGARAQDYGN